MSKISYVCNCCGKERIDIMLMDNIIVGNRTLHQCFSRRKLSEKKFIPISEFKAINKYDITIEEGMINMYIINPTVGHDCTLAELKRGLIKVNVIEEGIKTIEFLKESFNCCTISMNGYKRYYPKSRLTKDIHRANINRKQILQRYV